MTDIATIRRFAAEMLEAAAAMDLADQAVKQANFDNVEETIALIKARRLAAERLQVLAAEASRY